MPIYTYQCENEKCEKCGEVIEKRRKVDERNDELLCECGEPMNHVIELPSSPIFKGEGFTPRFHR